jgi:alkaline phosphatase
MKSDFKDIARQLIENAPGNKFNVIFGGGRDFFGVTDENYHQKIKFGGYAEMSCNRTDKINLVEKYLNQFNESTVKYVKNSAELRNVISDVDEVDQVLGLFANNHMSYNSLRNTEPDGEPSLSEMTKAAIKILENKKSKNGFVLMVEGGKIDHAHHQNHARFALEEFVEFEKAVKTAVDMTSCIDTLIIVTSDHGHSMIYNGYSKRGNDILGLANKENGKLYETVKV